MNNTFTAGMLGLALIITTPIVKAEAESVPLPADVKLVQFTYNAHDTFPIMTMPGNITDIQLHEGEKLIALALGDSVQWITDKTDQHIFIKPTKPNIYTSGTLVTDKRTYQLTLRSSPLGGKWYQRVSWVYPDLIVLKQKEEEQRKEAEAKAIAMLQAEQAKLRAMEMSTSVSKTPGNPVENLNFSYSYKSKGQPTFVPTQTFDDGVHTWIRIPPSSQEMPALFLIGADGKYELVNYVRDGQFLKVNRLFKEAVLKIGADEVRVTNDTATQGKNGWFSRNTTQGQSPWPMSN
jgi:P-type conjugative transfer protein VirB9